jgi:hypothetical protein
MNNKAELFAEVSRQLSGVGRAELELAFKRTDLSKANSLTERVQKLKDCIHLFREPHIPKGTVLGAEGWNALYESINDAAARELSKSVNDRISALEAEQATINSAIASERAAIKAKYTEFESVLPKAEKLQGDLQGYQSTRSEIATAEADYESLYTAYCLGRNVNVNGFFGRAEMIVTKGIKLKVVEKLETSTKKSLADLQKRNRELAKELNLQPHEI